MNRRKLLLAAPALILAPSLLLPPKRALGGSVTLLGAGKPGGGGASGTAPTLDGAGATGAGVGTAVVSGGLTTSNTNDILVAIVCHDRVVGAGSATTMGSPTDSLGAHLSWVRRGSQVATAPGVPLGGPGTPYVALDVFWALSAAAQPSMTFSCTAAAACDNWGVIVLAVSGCGNTAAPWDANGSLPGSASLLTNTSSAPTISGISTTSPGTLMLMSAVTARSSSDNGNQTTAGSFTGLTNITASGGSNFSRLAVQTAPFTTVQSGITPAFGSSWNGWLTLVDALVGT